MTLHLKQWEGAGVSWHQITLLLPAQPNSRSVSCPLPIKKQTNETLTMTILRSHGHSPRVMEVFPLMDWQRLPRAFLECIATCFDGLVHTSQPSLMRAEAK